LLLPGEAKNLFSPKCGKCGRSGKTAKATHSANETAALLETNIHEDIVFLHTGGVPALFAASHEKVAH
jgi:hypothetical protein